MKKSTKLLSLLLCLSLLFSLVALSGCSGTSDVHDHDHGDDAPSVTDLPIDDRVPLAEGLDGDEPSEAPTPTDPPAPTEAPAPDPATCSHNWVDGKWTTEGFDCIMGECHVFYKECSICGAKSNIAYRNWDKSKAPGHHTWKETQVSSGCSGNPTVNRYCTVCGQTEVTKGGHNWGAWTASGDSVCTAGETRTCSLCHQTETRGATGHSWRLLKTTPATCTEPSKEEQECSRCHATRTVEKGPALGHNFGGLTDCTVARKCVRCNETKPAGSHSWGEYVKTAQGHYQRCALCSQTTDMAAHTDNGAGYCSVCGYQMKANATTPTACSHDYQVVKGSASAGAHTEKCSKCGATQRVSCASHPDYSSRRYCTDPLYCVCGAKISDGQKNHNFGTSSGWTTTATTHERRCLNSNCQYVVSEQHTFTASQSCTSPTKCSVCGYASGSAAYSDHAWGAWVNSGSGSHSRSCTHPGCTAKQSATHSVSSSSGDCTSDMLCADCGAVIVEGSSGHVWGHAISVGEGGHNQSCLHPGCSAKQNSAHSGGTATCTSPAQCSECGGYYGAKNPSNHSGGTELRNVKAAQVGVEGYTGDTYCLGCGQKLADGEKIPALADDHTHSYGGWVSDSTHHWHECECGDIKDNTAHIFKDGKCTVCGAADPDYKAPAEHVHTFTDSWNADSQNHWHVCTSCGAKADVTAHVIVTEPDGSQRCIDCGLTLKEKTEKENTESAVDKFNDVKESDFYASSVGWAVKNKITQGTGNGAFSPTKNCTEAEILTMLYRAAGSPAVSGSAMEGWSGEMGIALTWASENGLLDENFDPRAICTRSSAVTYMWRAAGSPNVGSSNFSDVPGSASYAQAVAWAVNKNITQGTGNGSFSPDLTCDRSQIVTFLYREAN